MVLLSIHHTILSQPLLKFQFFFPSDDRKPGTVLSGIVPGLHILSPEGPHSPMQAVQRV